jgi:hypothetical protein
LTVLHFRYAPNVLEFNGGRFVYFHRPPAQLAVIDADHPQNPVGKDADPTYLAFLTRAPDGRFHPVTGHYDSEPSFRLLATPIGGAVRYTLSPPPPASEVRPGDKPPAGSLTPEAAGALARQLANEQAQALYRCQPFQDNSPATFVRGRWLWHRRQGQGTSDLEVTVEFLPDGRDPSVKLIMLHGGLDPAPR